MPEFLSRNKFLPAKGETNEEKLSVYIRELKQARDKGQFDKEWEEKYGPTSKAKKNHNSTMSKVLGVKDFAHMLVLMMSLGVFHFSNTLQFSVSWMSKRVDVYGGVGSPCAPATWRD